MAKKIFKTFRVLVVATDEDGEEFTFCDEILDESREFSLQRERRTPLKGFNGNAVLKYASRSSITELSWITHHTPIEE